MIFTPTRLGACLVAPEPRADLRGFFARTWDPREFAAHGLDPHIAQCSISVNPRKGTLRGMHYQLSPHEEAKLVRCVRGAVYDVIIDLRPDSPTYLQHESVELSHQNHLAYYVPKGFAHGLQTLIDDTEVWYQISVNYAPEHSRGVRWNDPLFGIHWPVTPPVVNERDGSFPDYPARVVRRDR